MGAILHYNRLFSAWNDAFMPSFRRRLEYGEVLRALEPIPDDSILEVGCNSGSFVQKLTPYCASVTGIDVNRDAIANSGLPNLRCMSAESLDFPDSSFDKVVSMHTIEHVPDVGKALREMCRVVKRSGRVVLLYPFEVVRGVSALPTACVVYRNPFACRRLHLHKLGISRIKELISGTGLRVASHRLVFSPLPVYLTVLEKSA